jgi:hypothetical protein
MTFDLIIMTKRQTWSLRFTLVDALYAFGGVACCVAIGAMLAW